MKKMNKAAITIVELIVVITILAILGTISMLAFQGYTVNARDSVRVKDLNTIKTAIEYARIEQGQYITPDNGIDITYSGSVVVRNQGVFGNAAKRKTKRLDKVPVDPLTEDEYTFSVTANGGEFELGAIMEGDDIVYEGPSILNSTYAATSYRAYINGTYNGKIAKASSGGLDYIFALPSIISTDLGTPTISYITTNNLLVKKGYENLPSSYNNTDNGSSTPLERDFVNDNKVVVFEGNFDDLKDNETEQVLFLSNLQEAYQGTVIEDSSEIKEILDVNTVDNTEGTQFLAQSLIKNTIDKKFEITAENTYFEEYNPIANSCLEMTGEMTDNLNTYFSGALNLSKEEWCDTTSIALTDYNVTKNFSGSLPLEIGNLNNLISIDIRASWSKPGGIDTFPETLKYLTNLTSIRISENRISNIENLALVNSLESIYIDNVYSFNSVYINDLGLLKVLDNLTYLSINSNVSNLSEFFTGNAPLVNLHLLKVTDNNIPNNIGQKTNLGSLSLAGTFNSISGGIGDLTNLYSLVIGGESTNLVVPNLQNLPSEIGQLSNLRFLTVGRTQITELPESFSNLTQLERLSIGFNDNLTSLFSGIGNLTELSYIRAQKNDLQFLPESMVNLTKVTTFYIDFNPSHTSGNSSNYYLYNLLPNYVNGDNRCEENIMRSGTKTCISMSGGKFTFTLVDNGGYTLNADKTVLSANATSLFWQTHKLNNGNGPSYDDVYLWTEAEAYCNDLELGGMSNWRVPTFVESRYIIDKRFSNPMVDTNFLSSKNEYYWSSTGGTYSSTQKRRTLNYADGTRSFYGESIFPANSHTKRPVRCVHD